MRILLSAVGRDTHPTGICRVAASHAKALLANRVASRVSLAIGSWQEELFRRLLEPYADQIELLRANIRRISVARNFWYAAALPQLAKAYGADLVHLSYPAPIFRRAFRSPVVVTLHDLYPYDIPQNFGFPRYYLNRIILRQCLSSVDGIACVSSATRSRLEEIFPGTSRKVPVVVTGNYIESLSGAPAPPASLEGIRAEGFVLAVAQHRKNKNLDLLIRGFTEFVNREEFHGFLVIVGTEGPETASLHRLNKSLGVSKRVKFIRSILDSELRWLYANCSIFVVCSSIEGYCLPLVEAQANRARIVCSDIPVLRENGGAHCTYFSLAGNALGALANAMSACISQPAIEKGPDLHLQQSSILAEYSKLYSRVNAVSPKEVRDTKLNASGSAVAVAEDVD
jgi:glycosyltransferase involved in cell wall biosynthesis